MLAGIVISNEMLMQSNGITQLLPRFVALKIPLENIRHVVRNTECKAQYISESDGEVGK